MGGLNSLAGGLGDLVVDITAGNLGDGVAVLNLNRDKLDLGVVNTVLGDNFTTSMLDSGGDRVGNSMGNWSNWGNSKRSSNGSTIRVSSKELRISFSFSLTLSNGVIAKGRSITNGIGDFLANLLVFNLLGINSLLSANILS